LRGGDQWLRLQVGVLGLVLMRGWVTAEDPDAEALMAQIETLLTEARAASDPQVTPAGHREPRPGYALWAATYDRPGNPIVEVEQPIVQRLLGELPPGRALDAACGTGRHTAFLAGRGHRVLAVDASAPMLELTRDKVPEAAALVATLTELPLARASLDAAVCALALTHVPDLGRAIGELARVVRPGGRIVLSDLHPQIVSLGAHAGFVAADGSRHFVVNLVHLHSAYLAAFAAAGLRVRACIEPEFADAALNLSGALQRLPEAARQALAGIPALLVWDLERLPG
jgi:ubiquinone/menaquinone biosynthesis C-methylase UbiE